MPRCEGSVAGTAVREEWAAAGQDAATERLGCRDRVLSACIRDSGYVWLRGLSLQPGKETDSITHMSSTEVTQQQVPAPAAALNSSECCPEPRGD